MPGVLRIKYPKTFIISFVNISQIYIFSKFFVINVFIIIIKEVLRHSSRSPRGCGERDQSFSRPFYTLFVSSREDEGEISFFETKIDKTKIYFKEDLFKEESILFKILVLTCWHWTYLTLWFFNYLRNNELSVGWVSTTVTVECQKMGGSFPTVERRGRDTLIIRVSGIWSTKE